MFPKEINNRSAMSQPISCILPTALHAITGLLPEYIMFSSYLFKTASEGGCIGESKEHLKQLNPAVMCLVIMITWIQYRFFCSIFMSIHFPPFSPHVIHT